MYMYEYIISQMSAAYPPPPSPLPPSMKYTHMQLKNVYCIPNKGLAPFWLIVSMNIKKIIIIILIDPMNYQPSQWHLLAVLVCAYTCM